MAEGRRATVGERYDDAIVAFDRAVRARPVDARARAERGFAYLKKGSTERAILDFSDVRVLTTDRSLLAQTYFNWALAARRLDRPEDERLALVLAARRGSSEAKSRLADRSACPAIWFSELGKEGPIARNFRELAQHRNLVNCPYHPESIKTEAEARRYVCHGCAEDAADLCDGAGPWTIDSGYMSFQNFQFFFAPLPGNLYFYSAIASTPYRVQGGHLLVTEEHRTGLPLVASDQNLFIQGRFSGSTTHAAEIDNNGRWSDEDSDASICDLTVEGVDLGDFRGAPTIPWAGPTQTTAYSLQTKHERFVLAVYDGSVSLSVGRDQARVHGDGCEATVTLPSDP